MNKTESELEELMNLLKQVRDNPEKLISSLLDTREKFSFETNEFKKFAQSFSTRKKINVLEAINYCAQKNFNIYELADLFSAMIPISKVTDIKNILHFLITHSEKTQNDMANSFLIQPLAERAKADPFLSKSLIIEILEIKNSRLYGYLLSLYLNDPEKSAEEIFNQFIQLINSDDLRLVANGLRGLGLITNYEEDLVQLSSITLLSHLHNPNVQIVSNAMFSLCRLTAINKVFLEDILEISQLQNPTINFEIISFLKFKKDEWSDLEFEILSNLLRYDLNLKGMNQSLDFTFYGLITPKYRDRFTDAFTKWLEVQPKEELRLHTLEDIFPHTLYQVANDKVLMTCLATNWFNSDDSKFHRGIKEIISYMNIKGKNQISFDKDALSTMSYDDLLYMIRKVLGYVVEFDSSSGLIFSILEKNNLTTEERDLIKSVITEHLGYNFIKRTMDLIENYLANDKISKLNKIMLKDSIKILKKRKEQISSINRINELLPNSDGQLKINKSDQKNMSKAMKASQKKSPLLSMIPRLYIKEGLSTFSYHSDFKSYTKPSDKMGSYETSFELPKKDVLDEIGAAMDRFGFRQAKRGEK